MKLCPETLQMPCLSLITSDMYRLGREKGTVHWESHSTFVFNAKDFSASPQMSHLEEVLCKRLPELKSTPPPHAPDTSSYSICGIGFCSIPHGFMGLSPVVSLSLAVRGREIDFPIPLSDLPVSRGKWRGVGICVL